LRSKNITRGSNATAKALLHNNAAPHYTGVSGPTLFNTRSVKVYFWLPPCDNASAYADAISLINITPSIDETAPVITLNGASAITLEFEDAYIEAGATASDNDDGNLTS
jgi:hypothetical protein